MSNEADKLISEIQYKTGLSLEEIADKIGYSRPYLNNVKLKGGGKKVIGVLREKFAEILQNVPRATFNNQGRQEPEDQKNNLSQEELLSVLVQLIRTQNRILEKQEIDLVERVKDIEVNLKDALGRVDSIKLDVYSGKIVILESLARLEKKKSGALISEADSIVSALLSEHQRQQGRKAEKSS